MRLTIEPTDDSCPPASRSPKVILETASDDLHASEMVELFLGAVVAYGFARENIVEYFEEVATLERGNPPWPSDD